MYWPGFGSQTSGETIASYAATPCYPLPRGHRPKGGAPTSLLRLWFGSIQPSRRRFIDARTRSYYTRANSP